MPRMKILYCFWLNCSYLETLDHLSSTRLSQPRVLISGQNYSRNLQVKRHPGWWKAVGQMRLLLINPKFPESFWSFKWANTRILPHSRTGNPPLGLATLAALTPDGWNITLIDENVTSIPLQPAVDLIGICGMAVQFDRQKELSAYYRSLGYYVVMGGSYASLCPEKYTALADCVIAGEAEYIWPAFCRDFESGQPKPFYQETGVVNLADSPVPRFELLALDQYRSMSLQFSRGCPFRCDFCDIIVMFGRKPRTKNLKQVGRELDRLRELGTDNVFFVDDNLIGNIPRAKALLRFLIDYQRRHAFTFSFGTEASLNMAYDAELLTLFRQANFAWVFIGIESPDAASLRETKKLQNVRQDMLTSIRTIYANGIDIYGGFIVGFDHDTTAIFKKQFRFILEAGIQMAMVGLLTAPPKTPLYTRLEQEGRLVPDILSGDNTSLSTNVIPKAMNMRELIQGYRWLYENLVKDRNIARRIRSKLQFLANPDYSDKVAIKGRSKTIWNFLIYGILPGGIPRLFYFLSSWPVFKPRLIPLVIQDWILGLSMRHFVEAHFKPTPQRTQRWLEQYFERITTNFKHYITQDKLEISFNHMRDRAANLSISITGRLDKDFFQQAEKELKKVLHKTSTSITLQIEEFQEAGVLNINRLLNRLARYGDRVTISMDKKFLTLLEIDSSIFNLKLI